MFVIVSVRYNISYYLICHYSSLKFIKVSRNDLMIVLQLRNSIFCFYKKNIMTVFDSNLRGQTRNLIHKGYSYSLLLMSISSR